MRHSCSVVLLLPLLLGPLAGCDDDTACRSYCGDHRRTCSEECDDGNQRDGDGCSARCLLEEPECGDHCDLGLRHDAGPGSDLGPAPDLGPPPDLGPAPDLGPPPDLGPAPDLGPEPDGGPAEDAGAPDGGPIEDIGAPDGGPAPDLGPEPDGGPAEDTGAPDGGPAEDAGRSDLGLVDGGCPEGCDVGAEGDGGLPCRDEDEDGQTTCQGDCADDDPRRAAGRPEIPCNGIDDDCDPRTPDDLDLDDDGVSACDGDCDDEEPGRSPLLDELPCNGIDDDCDPRTPDDPNADGDPISLCQGDCDDGDPRRFPGAHEQPCSGIDEDCDEATPDGEDADDDGVSLCAGDCADQDPTRRPGLPEIACNGRDDDCDPATPDDSNRDGDPASVCAGDCADDDPQAYPGAREIPCNGRDDDCDPATPDAPDADGDGVGLCAGDCDDDDPERSPLHTELTCNGRDDDCDPGTADDPDPRDEDGDGATAGCGGDCDDGDPTRHPGAEEQECDGVDQDCRDDTPDDPDPRDEDEDGYTVGCGKDCDDIRPEVHPGAPEQGCNGRDDDCDPGTADDPPDGDGDGVSLCDGDCADDDLLRYPGNPEVPCNGRDDDCDPATADGPDDDGDGVSACGGDCDDEDPQRYPGNPEVPCNGRDDDCDPATVDAPDVDGDQVGLCAGDCDDRDPNRFPGNLEVPCNGRDDDCDRSTADNPNRDGDPVSLCAGDCDDEDPQRYPGNPEVPCNGRDDDCAPLTLDAPDEDGDGVGLCAGDCDDRDPARTPGRLELTCNLRDDDCDPQTPDDPNEDRDPVSLCAGDCEDEDPLRYPGAAERHCNGFDDDCDAATADDPNADRDPVSLCRGDCDDDDPARYPGNPETPCNGRDDDCSLVTPDAPDADRDGVTLCAGDCDDRDATRFPGNLETPCNGKDDDCAPLTLDAPDADRDGVTLCAGDCDDRDATRFPGNLETPCNGKDDDCSPLTLDAPDEDGDGVTLCAGDCDDRDAARFPGNPEVCGNTRDDDCNGAADCDDPACAAAPVCQTVSCQAPLQLPGSGSYVFEASQLADAQQSSCGTGAGGEIVATFELLAPRDLHLDTQGSEFPTVLSLRQGDCASGSELGCSQGLGHAPSWGRIERLNLPAGRYHVLVEAAAPGLSGRVALQLALAPPPTAGPAVAADPLLRMPGTQPDQGVALEAPGRCLNCHAGYDPAVEPGRGWRGSMMGHAARDFLFWSAFAVAVQDSAWVLGNGNAGDLCERCHFPKGWLAGRSDPANASAMTGADYDGVQCDFCHRMYDPHFEDAAAGLREGQATAAYWDETDRSSPGSTSARLTTLQEDRAETVLTKTFDGQSFFGADYRPRAASWTEATGGQYFVALAGGKRASFADDTARHVSLYSRYHKSRTFCATCHDVSNPVLANLEHAAARPGDGGGLLPTEQAPAGSYFHVERTYSEFALSAYARGDGALGRGAYAPDRFATSLPGERIGRCQDCHLPDVRGRGCDKNDAPVRPDGSLEHPASGQPLHDLAGGNAWVGTVLASTVAGAPNYDATNAALLRNRQATLTLDLAQGELLDAAMLLEGAQRALVQLRQAARLTELTYAPATGLLRLKVMNDTGHKLISGFPEGRRMFLNVRAYQGEVLLREVNPYDAAAGTLKGLDPRRSPASPPLAAHEQREELLVYEMHPSSSLTGEDESFHFVLATGRYKDNRIPPLGFDAAAAPTRQVQPVWHGEVAPDLFDAAEYAGGYDAVQLSLPAGADRIEARLYYQTTSREYVEFLRDQLTGRGLTLDAPTPAGGAVAYRAVAGDPFFARLVGWGETLWQLWEHNRHLPGAAPVLMTEAVWVP